MERAFSDNLPSPRGMQLSRRAWGRSVLLALMAHVVVAVIVVTVATLGFDAAGDFDSETIIRGALLPEARTEEHPVTRTEPVKFEGVQAIAFEPGVDQVRRAVALIADAAERPPDPDAIVQLSRKAEILEHISSPAEISNMAGVIAGVLGVEAAANESVGPAGAGAFDFDRALLTDSSRVEDGDRLRIVETLSDPDGREQELIWLRTVDPATGAYVYEQAIATAGKGPEFFETSADEFEDAEARNRPYAVINRYPLVGQLHRQAVLPILRKLSESDE